MLALHPRLSPVLYTSPSLWMLHWCQVIDSLVKTNTKATYWLTTQKPMICLMFRLSLWFLGVLFHTLCHNCTHNTNCPLPCGFKAENGKFFS